MSWALRSAVAGAVVVSLLTPLGAVRAADDVPGPANGSRSETGSVQVRPARATIHSSDGVRGPLLSDFPRSTRLAGVRTNEVGWQVAPGLDYAQWTEAAPQGLTRIYLLTARLDQPGLVLDQVSGPTVSAHAPLSRWVAADHAVAAVNADFFDISDTGAPLGVGVDRQRSLLHAPRAGWNTTFLIDVKGNPYVLPDRLVARVVRRGGPPIRITNFNSPTVARGGIGLYTAAWGGTAGKRVANRALRVRQVVVRGGIVRSNRRKLSSGTLIHGEMLVGRDRGARVLRSLRVGQRVTVQKSLSIPARVAVSGSVRLLHNGQATTRDNKELHPRTAIGIDRDQRLLHLVVVDGRSESSGGKTLLQLAQLLRSLGDEEGLNLDGGGSSTMIARDPLGRVAVRNKPSDGHERAVPNGLGFRYSAPPG